MSDVVELAAAVVPEVFTRLPRGWVFATASPQEQDILLAAVGELLAEEHFRGAEATAKIELLIVGARAAAVRQWLPDARTKFEQMIAAEKLLTEYPPEELARQRREAADKVRRTGDELARAQARFDEAEAEQRRIEQVAAAREEAEKLLSSNDVVLRAAWKKYTALRAAQRNEEKEHDA